MKRIFAFALVIVLAFGLLAGCSAGGSSATATPAATTAAPSASAAPEESEEPESLGGVYPIVTDGSVTLSIWYPLAAEVSAYIQDLANGENYAWKGAMEATGIKLRFEHPASSATTESFQLMVSSGDYTDIVNTGATMYTGGATKAVEDGVYIALTDYLTTQNLAPNYMRWVGLSEINQKYAKTDSGDYVSFSQVYDRSQPQFLGYAVRGDWMDDLGLELPVTISDWHDMLVSFKENKTADGAAPMELQASGIPASSFFIGAYGAAASDYFIQRDGVVAFSAMEDSFRSYLETMSQWYGEGLIDPDFITNGGFGFTPNNTRVSLDQSGEVPMMYTWAGDYMAKSGMAPEGATFDLTPIPKVNADDPLYVNFKRYENLTGGGATITTNCANPEYAVRFIDYFYSDEGMLLANYGIEGVTFNYNSDGKPMHTDLIAHNPDGMTTTYAQQRYLIHNGFMVFILDREEDVQSEDALKYRDLWAGIGICNLNGNLNYSAADGAERSSILNDVNTLVGEFTLAVISGQKTIDDSTWDTYVSQLKSQNIERAVELTQAAYDRYLAR